MIKKLISFSLLLATSCTGRETEATYKIVDMFICKKQSQKLVEKPNERAWDFDDKTSKEMKVSAWKNPYQPPIEIYKSHNSDGKVYGFVKISSWEIKQDYAKGEIVITDKKLEQEIDSKLAKGQEVAISTGTIRKNEKDIMRLEEVSIVEKPSCPNSKIIEKKSKR